MRPASLRTLRALPSTAPLLAVVLAACSNAPRIAVVNAGDAPLVGVVVSGNGFEHPLGTIAPGARAEVRVQPRGETGLTLAFEREGRRVMHGPDGYFEASGGYEVVATVRADGSVEVRDEL
ncbi:MAG: hypothetical protein RIR65_303 [Planctomycetota bacterium]|jgi:hypothetical protein